MKTTVVTYALLVQAPILVASFLAHNNCIPPSPGSFILDVLNDDAATTTPQRPNDNRMTCTFPCHGHDHLWGSSSARRNMSRDSSSCLNLWPFKMSSGDDSNGGNGGGGQHLIRAGQELHIAAKSVGPANYACPNLLKDVGNALEEIGEYWTESWEAVTYAADDASGACFALAQLQSNGHPELATLYSSLSGELKEISSIVGCTSIGPPTAASNLEGISQTVKKVAIYVEKCGDECSEDSRAFGKSLRKVSKSVGALAKEYQ